MSGIKNHRGWGWIRKRGSGRYQASYLGPDGQRHYAPVTFDDKMDAEQWLAKERNLIKDSVLNGETWRSPAERAEVNKVERETLGEYAARWIEQRNLKPRTRIEYTAYLEKFIAPKLGNIAVSGLTPQTIRTWYAGMPANRPVYRKHAYGLLKSICNTALKDSLLDRNPCQIDGATAVKTKTQAVIPTVSELAAIAEAIEPERFKAFVLISAWCGLRYGEATELRRKDVKLNKAGEPEILSIERGVTHRTAKQTGSSQSRCMIDTPKSGKSRVVVVPPHIRADLKSHLETFVDADPESLLFPPVRGGCHLSDKVIRDALRKALISAGREGVRIHDLRHFAGTQVARVGNLVETMNHLGHSTVAASLRYQHQVSGRDVEIAEALSVLATKPALAAVPDADDPAKAV